MKFALIVLLFIASGFSSLIYQVVWTRMLVFVFGSTTFATATVLSVFMGGLALGSYLAGQRADNFKRPFLWYGFLEGIIGVWALAAPIMFDAATPLYRYIWQNFHLSPVPFGILRFLAAAVILIVPTTCMGATLPLLSKYVADTLEKIGQRIGTLYAANTLGAVGGAATAGLYMLPTFGLNHTITIAAAINFALVIAVSVISGIFDRSSRLSKKTKALSRSRVGAEPGNISLQSEVQLGAPLDGALKMIGSDLPVEEIDNAQTEQAPIVEDVVPQKFNSDLSTTRDADHASVAVGSGANSADGSDTIAVEKTAAIAGDTSCSTMAAPAVTADIAAVALEENVTSNDDRFANNSGSIGCANGTYAGNSTTGENEAAVALASTSMVGTSTKNGACPGDDRFAADEPNAGSSAGQPLISSGASAEMQVVPLFSPLFEAKSDVVDRASMSFPAELCEVKQTTKLVQSEPVSTSEQVAGIEQLHAAQTTTSGPEDQTESGGEILVPEVSEGEVLLDDACLKGRDAPISVEHCTATRPADCSPATGTDRDDAANSEVQGSGNFIQEKDPGYLEASPAALPLPLSAGNDSARTIHNDSSATASEIRAVDDDCQSLPTGTVAPDSAAATEGKSSEASPVLQLAVQTRATLICFAISGAVAMIYEVGWTRTLLMVIGSSTYAFTIMLTTFLSGIFLGSLVCARLIDRAKHPLAWLAVIQLIVGAASLCSMAWFNYVPYWNLQLNAAFPHDPGNALAARFAIAATTMMPLTFFLGAIFPAAVRVCVQDLSKVGKSIGVLYSANTIGAIVGAFAAGFVLVPTIGVEKSLVAGSVVNFLCGVSLLYFVPAIRKSVKVFAIFACLGASGFLLCRPDIWEKHILVYAQSARRRLDRIELFKTPVDFKEWLIDRSETVYYHDGASSTVAVLEWLSEDGKKTLHHSLVTNGHVDASDQDDMGTQLLLACTPIAVHPDPKDVAVIGWGSGVTVGAAATLTDGNVTAIELEPAVVATSPYFHRVNHAPEKNPKVKIELNDGRNYLLATDKKFDVIISEPSNPWQAGVCNLFTKEYFQLAKDRLRPGGIFALWSQIVEVPEKNLRGVLGALHQVFPHCAVLMVDDCDIVVLASNEPISVDRNRLKTLLDKKEIAADFKTSAIESPEAFLARFSVSPQGMDELIGNAPINEDDTNLLEYEVGRTYESATRTTLKDNLAMFNSKPRDLTDIIKWNNESDEQKAQTMVRIAREAMLFDTQTRANDWLQASLQLSPNIEGYRLLARLANQAGYMNTAFEALNEGLILAPNDRDTLMLRSALYLGIGDRQKARADIEKVLQRDPQDREANLRLAQCYAPQVVMDLMQSATTEENPELVQKLIAPALTDTKFADGHPITYWLAAWVETKKGNLTRAEELAKKVVALDRKFPAGVQLLAQVLFQQGKYVECSACWFSLFKKGENSEAVLMNHANILLQGGKNAEALAVLKVLLTVSPLNPKAAEALTEMSKTDPKAKQFFDDLINLKKSLR